MHFIHYICVPDEGFKKELKHCIMLSTLILLISYVVAVILLQNFKTITTIKRSAYTTAINVNNSITRTNITIVFR